MIFVERGPDNKDDCCEGISIDSSELRGYFRINLPQLFFYFVFIS